jgi:hypothetical protein
MTGYQTIWLSNQMVWYKYGVRSSSGGDQMGRASGAKAGAQMLSQLCRSKLAGW